MAKAEYTTQNACDGCGCFGHCKVHRMPGAGVRHQPHVMIVGEAPGAQEDERGRPFVGPAGQMLVEGLRKAKYALPGDVYIRNAVSCRPTNGNANRTPSTDEIRRCHVFLRDDIERVRPNVILALGAVAASSLMGQTKVALKNVRMRKFDYVLSDGTAVPCYVTYHPSYIMRMQRESPATFKSLSVDWVRDLHAVLEAGRGTSTVKGVDYRIVKTEDRLVEFMRWLRDVKNPTAYDTEASNLNPFGADVRLLTCAFSDRERFAWALPINHPEFHWRKHAMTDFVRSLRNFFKRTDVVKIGANIKFDNNQIHRHLGVEVALPYRDVQFLQFCFDEERADNDLKTLAMAYTDMGAYDASLDAERERIEAQLKKDKRAYDKLVKAGTAPAGKSFEMRYDYLPLDMLLEYNAADADATIRVHNYLFKKLTPSLRLVANELMSRGGQFVERIEFNGAHIDQVAVESIRAKYTAEVDDTTRKLRASRPVQDFEAACLHELIEAEKEKKRPNIDRVLEKGFSFNPNSSAQLGTVLFTPKDEGGFGFPVVARTEKGGEPSTNAEAMGELMRRYPDNKVLKALQAYREKTKVIGTYLEPALGEWVSDNHDRFVRSTYNLRARTGRTTCIAKGTLVEVVRDVSKYPDGVPIEDVKAGDRVYCFDENCRLTTKPVRWAGKTGRRKVVRLHWLGDGRHSTGFVDLTPDHRVRLITGEYRQAQDLVKGDRILSISRDNAQKNGYSRLFVTGYADAVRDHRFVYESVHGNVGDGVHIHHRDGNKQNNTLSNLVAETASEHASGHLSRLSDDEARDRRDRISTALRDGYASGRIVSNPRSGAACPNYLGLTREWLAQKLHEYAGKPAILAKSEGVDYATLQKYMRETGVDWRSVAAQYTVDGRRITRELVDAARSVHENSGQVAAQKFIGMGYYRWKSAQEKFSYVPYNHSVTRIEVLESSCDVYDLEVEGVHNFVAGGLCVHNSSHPNLQNIPADVKPCFTSRWPNGFIVEADFSQVELRVMACLSRDSLFVDTYVNGGDLHLLTMCNLFNITPEEAKQIEKDDPKLYKRMRTIAKRCVVGGTLVQTDSGYVPVESLVSSNVVGRQRPSRPISVVSYDGLRPVDSVYFGGVQPVVEIGTEKGFRIKQTLDHEIPVVRDGVIVLIPTSELSVGDATVIKVGADVHGSSGLLAPFDRTNNTSQKTVALPERLTETLAAWLGYVVSEGSFRTPSAEHTGYGVSVSISEKDRDVVKHIDSLYSSLFPFVRRRSSRGTACWDLTRKDVVSWLFAEGLGDNSSGMCIPRCVLSSPRSVKIEFLRALFTGDGCVKGRYVSYTSKSENLVRQVSYEMLNLGVVGGVSSSTVAGYGEFWTWTTSCIDDFARIVGFYADRKNKAIAKQGYSRKRSVLFVDGFGSKIRDARFRLGPSLRDKMYFCEKGQSRLGDRLFTKDVADALGGSAPFMYENGLWTVLVTSITASGSAPVYDVYEPVNKVMVANGLVSGDCNFGILYGQGAPGLVDTLKGENIVITLQDAKSRIESFSRTYKGVMRWIRKTHEFCRENGYVTTPFGRVRRLPLINSHVDGERVHAENQAQNTPIQGTASDLTLLSGWIASEALKKSGLECKLCLTVHDSIEIDCKDADTAKEAARILQSIMSNCKEEIPEHTPFKTDWIIVPINADVSYGPSWAEQKSLDEEESAE